MMVGEPRSGCVAMRTFDGQGRSRSDRTWLAYGLALWAARKRRARASPRGRSPELNSANLVMRITSISCRKTPERNRSSYDWPCEGRRQSRSPREPSAPETSATSSPKLARPPRKKKAER